MLGLTCCFDLEKDIAQVVRAQRDPDVRKAKPDESIVVKIVGQERYDEILYVWNDISPISKEGPAVTLIGLYEPTKQKNSILFIHEMTLDIINCSVNQELTMIAYVERKASPIPSPKGSESNIYRAFLAEIHPQHRIFDLNVERSTLLRVQFLWNRRSADRETSASASRDSRLLFFLHKESIGLYQLSLARMGDKRVVMSGPPETTSLMKKFIWAQWDASTQRLFVVFIKSKQGDDRVPPVLRCLEFKNSVSAPNTKMTKMELTLPFPIYWDGTQEGYYNVGMSRVISDKGLNMEVVHQSGGSLCICYQHPVKKRTKSQLHQDASHNPLQTGHSEEPVDLSYSVLAVHHMKVLYGSALQVPWDMAVNTKLYFSSMAGYVLVYAPGVLLHLLNVSPDVEPCLHIAIPQEDIPTTPVYNSMEHVGMQSQNLTYFPRERTASLSGGCIYNSSSGRAYKMCLNKDRIAHFLDDGMSQSLKVAIIHLVLVHLRDQSLLKKIMEPILAKPTSLELKEMIAEILVGSTFSTIRRQIERDEALLLPFTNTDPGRSQFVEAPDGDRLASFKSSTFKFGAQDSIAKRDMKERRSSVDGSGNFWEILDQRVKSLVLMGKPLPRFNTKSLRIGLEEKNQPSQSNRSRSITEPVFPSPVKPKSPGLMGSPSHPSLFKKVAASARKVMASRSKKQIREREEDFRILEETSHSAPDDVQEQLMDLTMDLLSNHMQNFMPAASNDKLLNIASEYVTCQLQQSKALIMTMINATGFPNPRKRENLKVSLLTAPPDQGREMFQLVEQYFMAVQQLSYPLPPGFYTLFTIAGFRCLDRHMFLQYLDHEVLLPTEEFMSRLMEDVPDDCKKNVEIKYQIITRLPRHTALQVLERWDHPISTRYLAQQYVADTLKDDTGRDYSSINNTGQPRRESNVVENEQQDEDSIASSFPPLSTLMKLLESKDPHVIIRSNKSMQEDSPQNVNIEPRFVEKVALQNTIRDYGRESLKDISF